jgi:hypothetical protein
VSAAASQFFEQLFRALELGKKKAEGKVLENLFERFHFPEGAGDPVAWFAANRAPEDIMGWLMAEVAPFAAMLRELYEWLAEIRATVGGNVREVTFDFATLGEQVPFSLDSFPKTYVRAWGDVTALNSTFVRDASGHLRIDTPNYWRDGVPALENLSYAAVLRPDVYDKLPASNRRAVATRVRHIVSVLEQNYLRRTAPVGKDVAYLGNHPVLYVPSDGDWEQILDLARRSVRHWHDRAAARAADELSTTLRRGLESGRLVDGRGFEELLLHAGPDADGDPPQVDALTFGDDLESDDTYAFLCAYDLCLPRVERTGKGWADVVDKVLLPFWRHRWRLFEVWSILWVRNALPEAFRPLPCLEPRPGAEGAQTSFAWVLAGGKATQPVATADVAGRTLSLWFQLETPLSPEDAERFRQDHIEPDVRLRERSPNVEERDLAILELKDRHLAPGGEEKRVGRMYATTAAPVVCVANYSPFRSESLHGTVYVELADPTTIYVVDEFRPGATPEEVADALRRAVEPPTVDILVDVSASIDPDRAVRVLAALPPELRARAGWFTWSDSFDEAEDEVAAVRAFDGETTNLDQALSAHERLGRKTRALVLTDADGARQFASLLQTGTADGSRYRCIDIATEVEAGEIAQWAGGRD